MNNLPDTQSNNGPAACRQNTYSCAAQLPIEVLGLIISFCLDDNQPLILPRGLRTDLRGIASQVNSHWRAVAFGTPQLWTRVLINLDSQPTEIATIAHDVLSRARGMPICVAARMSRFQNRAPHRPSEAEFIDKIIIPFSSSMLTLQLCVPFPYVKSFLTQSHAFDFPILKTLSLRQATIGALKPTVLTAALSLPKLKTVELDFRLTPPLPSSITNPAFNFIPWVQLTTFANLRPMPAELCLNILSSAPALKSCGVYLERIEDIPEWPLGMLTLRRLKRLHIRFTGHINFDTFLNLLNLPAIKDLALKEYDVGLGWTGLLGLFLNYRCGSGLESLYIASTPQSAGHLSDPVESGFDTFILKHSSTLKKLFLPLFTRSMTSGLGLSRSLVSGKLCPRLERLSLDSRHWAWPHFTSLVDEVTVAQREGRTALKELHVFYFYTSCYHPNLDRIDSTVKSHTLFDFTLFVYLFDGYRPVGDLKKLEISWFGYHA